MLLQILKIRYPAVFGQSRQHFTIDNVREMKSILNNPPFHVCHTNKTLTCTFDISEDLNHKQWALNNKDLMTISKDPNDEFKKQLASYDLPGS